jgi:hypothetical protein
VVPCCGMLWCWQQKERLAGLQHLQQDRALCGMRTRLLCLAVEAVFLIGAAAAAAVAVAAGSRRGGAQKQLLMCGAATKSCCCCCCWWSMTARGQSCRDRSQLLCWLSAVGVALQMTNSTNCLGMALGY